MGSLLYHHFCHTAVGYSASKPKCISSADYQVALCHARAADSDFRIRKGSRVCGLEEATHKAASPSHYSHSIPSISQLPLSLPNWRIIEDILHCSCPAERSGLSSPAGNTSGGSKLLLQRKVLLLVRSELRDWKGPNTLWSTPTQSLCPCKLTPYLGS